MTCSKKKVDCYSQVFEETRKIKYALNRYLLDSTKIEGTEAYADLPNVFSSLINKIILRN